MTVFKVKDMPGLEMRKDLVFSDQRVQCPNASTLGYGLRYAKRGFWIAAKYEGSNVFGRCLGRVDSDAAPWVTDMIGILMLSSDGTFPIFRIIDPKDVFSSEAEVPARMLELMMADMSNPLAAIKRVQDGIPYGFEPYNYGSPLPVDPRWVPAVKE